MEPSFSIPGAEQTQRMGSQIVEFFEHAEKQGFKSEQEGRPIYEAKTYIRITQVGGKQVVERRARPEDFTRYAQQYALYQLGAEAPTVGTPLEQWPQLGVAEVAQLKALSIRTVEQLAEVEDGHLDKLGMGSRTLRDKAKAYLAAAKDGALVAKLTEKNSDLEAQIAALREEIKGIQERVDKTNKK